MAHTKQKFSKILDVHEYSVPPGRRGPAPRYQPSTTTTVWAGGCIPAPLRVVVVFLLGVPRPSISSMVMKRLPSTTRTARCSDATFPVPALMTALPLSRVAVLGDPSGFSFVSTRNNISYCFLIDILYRSSECYTLIS